MEGCVDNLQSICRIADLLSFVSITWLVDVLHSWVPLRPAELNTLIAKLTRSRNRISILAKCTKDVLIQGFLIHQMGFRFIDNINKTTT
jgi:hypothetical protein